MEKWIKQEEIHKGKIFSLWVSSRFDNGEVAIREYIRHSGGVGIVPVVDGKIILIDQSEYPLSVSCWSYQQEDLNLMKNQ
ncbi:hypothetical protein [Candidatus Villigracilis affinis]|uniref:hypothetical protein n=1 Tax=Candidatus Villigracilis affinis TaxID=3140682 RepID=UPI002A1A4322|nr:hypothetical protein [Anaerolineales bacterium]